MANWVNSINDARFDKLSMAISQKIGLDPEKYIQSVHASRIDDLDI